MGVFLNPHSFLSGINTMANDSLSSVITCRIKSAQNLRLIRLSLNPIPEELHQQAHANAGGPWSG